MVISRTIDYSTVTVRNILNVFLFSFSFCNDPIDSGEDDDWVENALREKWPPERIMAEFESKHSDTVDALEEGRILGCFEFERCYEVEDSFLTSTSFLTSYENTHHPLNRFC